MPIHVNSSLTRLLVCTLNTAQIPNTDPNATMTGNRIRGWKQK